METLITSPLYQGKLICLAEIKSFADGSLLLLGLYTWIQERCFCVRSIFLCSHLHVFLDIYQEVVATATESGLIMRVYIVNARIYILSFNLDKIRVRPIRIVPKVWQLKSI